MSAREKLRERMLLVGGVLLVLGVHLVLLERFFPVARAWSVTPLLGDDFDTHVGQTTRLLTALRTAGQHWGYSPQLLAGYPAGVIFDADNKGWAYWTYVLWRYLDVPAGRAFNLFAYLVCLAPPLVGMAAAWLFRLSKGAVLTAGALCVGYFYFDSFVHWCAWIGMIAYVGAAVLTLLPLGLFYRFVCSSGVLYGVLCAPLLAVQHLIHPYSFFVLALPLGLAYWRRRGLLRRSQHGVVLWIVALTVGGNAFWLYPSLSHWHYILDSGYFGSGGLDFLVADLANQLISPTDTGVIGTRATLRFGYVILALVPVVQWLRQGDLRGWMLGSGGLWLFFLAYPGAEIPALKQIQPYRHVIPLGFWAALPAAAGLAQLWRELRPSQASAPVKAAAVAVGFILFQEVVEHAFFFMPELAPEVAPLQEGLRTPFAAVGYPPRSPYTLPHDPGFHGGIPEITRWCREHIGAAGRVVVEELTLGERLAWDSPVEVIGGFRLRNLAHSRANILRSHADQVISPEYMRSYAQAYGITHLIMQREHLEFDTMPGVLRPKGQLYGRRLYEVVQVTPKLQGSGGRLVASFNRLELQGTEPDKTLRLSYHFHPALVCSPGCRVQQGAGFGPDDVGFIAVPAPHPADLVIENRY